MKFKLFILSFLFPIVTFAQLELGKDKSQIVQSRGTDFTSYKYPDGSGYEAFMYNIPSLAQKLSIVFNNKGICVMVLEERPKTQLNIMLDYLKYYDDKGNWHWYNRQKKQYYSIQILDNNNMLVVYTIQKPNWFKD